VPTTIFRVLGGRSHGVKLLPLIDVDQDAVGLLGLGIEAVADDATKLAWVACAIGGGFVLEIGVSRGRPSIFWDSSEGRRQGAQR
jgi:hypothetical protein